MTSEQAKGLIDDFERWLVATNRGGPLSRLERATLDTFLYFLMVARREAAPPAADSKP